MNWMFRSTCIIAVAAVASFIGPVASAATQVTVVGAGKGAGAFRMAGAIAETINKVSKSVNATNQESPGFVANTRMVAGGRVEFALSNGVLIDAFQRHQHPYEHDKKGTNDLRGIGPIAGAWLQIAVLADSDINSLSELKGKRVSLGPKGSNSAYMLSTVFKALGIYDHMRKDFLKWSDAATYMVDGKLDAFGIPNPIPSPSVLQAAESRPIHVLTIPNKVIDKFIGISKGYDKVKVDMSVYQGMKGKSITTIHYAVFLLTNANVPANVVYEVAKDYYNPKNRDYIVSVYKPLKVGLDAAQNDGFIKSMKSFHLKMHPGAVRYWKERGYIK